MLKWKILKVEHVDMENMVEQYTMGKWVESQGFTGMALAVVPVTR